MRNHFLVPLFILSCFASLSINAQRSDYELFKKAITDLNIEFQKKKPAALANYEKQKDNVEKAGLVSDKTQEELIAEAVEEAFTQLSENIKKNSPPPRPKIKFEQVYMIQGEGEPLQAAFSYDRSKEKVEWVSSEPVTFTETISIDEIENPKERERLQLTSDFYGSQSELVQINFIEALFTESKTESQYIKMLDDLKKGGYSLDDVFKKAKILDVDERIEFIKSGIMNIVNDVVSKQ